MPIYMFKKINSLEEKKNNTKEIQFFAYVAFLQKKKNSPFPLIKRHIYGKIWSVKNVIKG